MDLTFATTGTVDGRKLSGIVHTYGTTTPKYGGGRFAPGAFAKSISAGKVVSYAFHDVTKPLASQQSGTLRLKDGSEGLAFEIDLPEGVSYAEDIRALKAAGVDIYMSFRFQPTKATRQGGVKLYQDGDLYSVDPVAMPAFEGTSVMLSSAQPETALSATIKIRARALANRARVAPSEKPTPSGDPKPRV